MISFTVVPLSGVPLLIAASGARREGGAAAVGAHFNGKIDRPVVYGRALDPVELASLERGVPPAAPAAAWDFGADFASDQVTDRGPNGLHGRAINLPTRAVTGHNWTGDETRFSLAPDQYAAIAFHDDDLEDAGWAVDFELLIPPDWPSAVYAARLRAGDFEDYLPFFVRPPAGAARAPIAFLAPTLTYIAYADEHIPTRSGRLESFGLSLEEFLAEGTAYEAAAFSYILEQRLHSLYDLHTGGDGVIYSSRLRPILNFRPKYNKPNLRFKHPHLLNCDLYLVDWLEVKGYDFEIITDEDLDAEGVELLRPYRVIVTGSHPEYWTGRMLGALESYLAAGGRLMYLGGNGFYWVASVDRQRPHAIEVRRGDSGSRPWTSEAGEFYHSTTGELGGLWRFRGKPPQQLVGVGTTAIGGLDRAVPYRRTSHDPRAAFIFAGVSDNLIGNFGLHMGGAAGWEIDRADLALGTPPHALVVASSVRHSDAYQHVIEENLGSSPRLGGTLHPLVRADMTYFEGPNGGAVFSVGSLSWCGSLSHNGYDNSVSRITGNVLTRFASGEPIPAPDPTLERGWK